MPNHRIAHNIQVNRDYIGPICGFKHEIAYNNEHENENERNINADDT